MKFIKGHVWELMPLVLFWVSPPCENGEGRFVRDMLYLGSKENKLLTAKKQPQLGLGLAEQMKWSCEYKKFSLEDLESFVREIFGD